MHWPFRLAQRRLGKLSHRWPRVSVAYTAFLRISSDSHSHASRSVAVSLTREPPSGSAPTLGRTVEQYTTEILALEHRFKKKASVIEIAPETPMVPYLPDVLLDLREVPGPIDDAPRGVPNTQSTHQPTARALPALRCDIPRANSKCSLPLTTVPKRTHRHDRNCAP